MSTENPSRLPSSGSAVGNAADPGGPEQRSAVPQPSYDAALGQVLHAAEALARAVAAAPFPLRAVVGPEARACIQVPAVADDQLGRMLRVERFAALMPAAPVLAEDPAGFYWQAERTDGGSLVQVWTRLAPIPDPLRP
ncbi:hypothetical protein [Streptacidiphilus jiangxiensis]|uniref:Uncharacterized protein n=1 Tax=Streptacidiphilus jiangxiensis TaxID=235985 RepID=A0A1H8BA74_STRJI|nr:hypothetical protein [Streptacidiphilus jiangxiensis]SEM79712.1 hypothetical protein SAMN05414137_1607 [Streptacidiphilus jiangxiensis]